MNDQVKNIDRLIDAECSEQTENFDLSLRPKKLIEFIGQPQVQKNLSTFISAASSRQEAMDHALLFGPPGLGKTTLAHVVARHCGYRIEELNASHDIKTDSMKDISS